MRKNLSKINDFKMAQILGSSNFKRDIIFKDLITVNSYLPTDSISTLLVDIDKKSNYNKNLLNYVSNIILINDYDIYIEDLKEWADDDFSLFDNYCHKDLWDYQISLFKQGILDIKDKPKKEEPSQNWGHSDVSINNYLNCLPKSIASKALDVINKADPYEVKTFIFCEEGNDTDSLLQYTDIIFKEGTLLNKLFNIKEEGSGKAEALESFLFPSKIMGISDSFDVLLDNGKRIEIKSPNRASFRLGTKASIGNYIFFSNILKARSVLKKLVNQLGSTFKNTVSEEFYELSMQFLAKGNFKVKRALSSAIDSAELSGERLHLISLWFYLAHEEMSKLDTVLIKELVPYDRYEVHGNGSLLYVLNSLEYVKNPNQLKYDIEKELEECFNNIDELHIYNEKDKTISILTSSKDLIIDTISQNGIKAIERKYKKKISNILEETYYEWKDKTNVSFYDLYNTAKSEVLINC